MSTFTARVWSPSKYETITGLTDIQLGTNGVLILHREGNRQRWFNSQAWVEVEMEPEDDND